MQASTIGFVIALVLAPAAALAQAGPPGGPAGPPPESSGGPPPEGPGASRPPGAIGRDQFVQQRAEAAGRLFDRIDVNHTGYITRAQLRAFLAQRRGGAAGPGGPPQE
jgi:hypothetical protein